MTMHGALDIPISSLPPSVFPLAVSGPTIPPLGKSYPGFLSSLSPPLPHSGCHWVPGSTSKTYWSAFPSLHNQSSHSILAHCCFLPGLTSNRPSSFHSGVSVVYFHTAPPQRLAFKIADHITLFLIYPSVIKRLACAASPPLPATLLNPHHPLLARPPWLFLPCLVMVELALPPAWVPLPWLCKYLLLFLQISTSGSKSWILTRLSNRCNTLSCSVVPDQPLPHPPHPRLLPHIGAPLFPQRTASSGLVCLFIISSRTASGKEKSYLFYQCVPMPSPASVT